MFRDPQKNYFQTYNANGKRAPGRAKMCNFQKLAQKPTKSGQRLKRKAIPSFLGDGGPPLVEL